MTQASLFDRIARCFDTVDMDRRRVKQKSFLSCAFGGPNNFSGKDMRAGHAHLKLTEEYFDAVVAKIAGTPLERIHADPFVPPANSRERQVR